MPTKKVREYFSEHITRFKKKKSNFTIDNSRNFCLTMNKLEVPPT